VKDRYKDLYNYWEKEKGYERKINYFKSFGERCPQKLRHLYNCFMENVYKIVCEKGTKLIDSPKKEDTDASAMCAGRREDFARTMWKREGDGEPLKMTIRPDKLLDKAVDSAEKCEEQLNAFLGNVKVECIMGNSNKLVVECKEIFTGDLAYRNKICIDEAQIVVKVWLKKRNLFPYTVEYNIRKHRVTRSILPRGERELGNIKIVGGMEKLSLDPYVKKILLLSSPPKSTLDIIKDIKSCTAFKIAHKDKMKTKFEISTPQSLNIQCNVIQGYERKYGSNAFAILTLKRQQGGIEAFEKIVSTLREKLS